MRRYINHNYRKDYFALANMTIAAAAAAIAAVTGGATAAILATISAVSGTTAWLSAVVVQYVNYKDYAPKIGFYQHNYVYSGYNATGSLLYSYKTGVTTR